MTRCGVCCSILEQFNLFSSLFGLTPTSIRCKENSTCTCALPVTPTSTTAHAHIFVANSKEDARSLLCNRPTVPTILLASSRHTSGLNAFYLKSCTKAYEFTSDSSLALSLRELSKDKPAPIQVYYVPPDYRDTAKCSALAAVLDPDGSDSESEQEGEEGLQLKQIYLGMSKGRRVRSLFDSGATASFISQQLANKLGLSYQTSTLKSVAVANGKSVPILGIVHFPLQFGPVILNFSAHVLPTFLPDLDLIIGESSMIEFNIKLQYNPVQCHIQSASSGSGVILDNATGTYKTFYLPNTKAFEACLAVEDHVGLPNQISVQTALRCLRRHREQCFVAVIRPTEITPPFAPAPTTPTPIPTSTTSTPKTIVVSKAPPEFRDALQRLIDEFSEIFNEAPQAGGALVDPSLVSHTIKLQPGAKPPFRRNKRLSPLELAELKERVLEFLEKGIISPSNSPYGAPVLFVPKPNGTGLRFCLDYRALNQATIKTRYQLPRIDDLLDAAKGARFFSTLDLAGGYYQIKISPEDREKTAFSTPFGQYEWNVLPMGLTNAPASFMNTMQKVFEKHIGDFLSVYLDDLLLMSKTPEEHLMHLRIVFETLRKHRFQVKLSKCHFMEQQVKYLGHIISEEGVKPDPAKVQTLLDWEFPTTATGMMQFLGLANYFRKFIPNLSRLAAPLYHLTKKGVVFRKGEEAVLAFEAIKQMLASPPILAYPDPALPYELISDASITGCGAILTQNGRPIAYFSSKFSPAERNYTTTEQEMLGIIKALKEWRCYLEGCEGLTLVTDHNPLTYFSAQPTLSRRQARWNEFLSRFHFTVKYRPGATNPADPLSRLYGASAALLLLAVTVSEFNSDLLERIKTESLLDPHFQDEKATRKYSKSAGYWTYQGRIVVPASMQTEIIREHHSNVTSGHFSWSRTADLISRQFWWPHMRESVQAFVSSCLSCQRSKSNTNRPHGLLTPLSIPDSRWHTVTMDFIMDLPKSANGNNAIMVMVDKLTKYVHLVPLTKTCSAEDVARYFIAHCYQYHGMPKVLISDRDPRFTSNFWKAFCRQLGIEPRYSTAFHPETDGQTERTNRVLEEVLRHFIDGNHKNWEDLLPLAAFAMNNAKSSTTGETPFYLNHGSHPHTPLSLGLPEGRLPSLDAVFQEMDSTLTRVRDLIKSAQDRQKTYADSRFRRPHAFKAGDQVMLSTRNLKFRSGVKKLHPKFIGPFSIIEMVGENAARLALPSTYRIHPVFHVSLLKEYKADAASQPLPPEPLVEDGVPYYKVEKILSTRIKRNGKRKVQEFLIKWLGYDDSHNSWEPRQNLTEDLLKDYPKP